MKLFKKLRKGFTLIELVVVIAVIAILTAVSIVSYVSITNKAKQSNDQQKIDQVNLSAQALEVTEKPKTMHDALEAVEADGFVVENFKAEAKDYEFAYSLSENRFLILSKDKVVYPKAMTKLTKSPDIWKFSADKSYNDGYSHYLLSSVSGEVSIENGGLDVGKNNDITKVSFHSTGAGEYVVRTFGGEVQIGKTAENVAKGQIYLYGLADKSVVYAENQCLHNRGAVGKMELKAGKSIAEKGGIVYLVEAKAAGVEIKEDGGKFIIPAEISTTDVLPAVAQQAGYTNVTSADSNYSGAKKANNSYDIGSLAELETFRDLVNGGFAFSGCTVKLTANITLNEGWRPIGEGSREVGATKYKGNYSGDNAEARAFFGEFDGNGKTISNLSNIGFVPRFSAKDKPTDTFETYCYGFFGIVSGNAYIHDITFKNVNIDATAMIKNERNVDVHGDSIAAAIGFIGYDGTPGDEVRVKNIKVSGVIKGVESTAGVVGRAYPKNSTLTIEGCKNEAAVTSNGKAAGIIGTVSNVNAGYVMTVKDNTNTGTITSLATFTGADYHRAGGIAVSSTAKANFALSTGNLNSGKLYVGSVEKASALLVYTSEAQA